jgi:transcriptional regulator with XRE-family HTH domain
MANQTTYLKEWRKFRHLTQEQVLDRLAIVDDPMIPRTGASLSRLENGKQVYSQRILEALADIYQCDPADLIGRNPYKEGELIDLMAILNERQRGQALAVIQALQQAS